jgi:hypothetical protein
MDEDRLPTKLWLDGYLRQHAATGQACYVTHRGEKAGGTVALRLILPQRQGCRVLTQARDMDGNMGWMAAFEGRVVPEEEAEAYLARLISRDPDVWVVDLETRDGSHPFPGREL